MAVRFTPFGRGLKSHRGAGASASLGRLTCVVKGGIVSIVGVLRPHPDPGSTGNVLNKGLHPSAQSLL